MTAHPLVILLVSALSATAAPRVANVTINMPPAPPVSTIELENAFPALTFSSPLCLRSPDGDTRRLFVCEKGGDLELIPDVTATTPTKTVFLDVAAILATRGEAIRTNSEMGLLAVAFHPDYASNGFFFTVYNVRIAGLDYQRLSRWHDPDIADTIADPDSEEILIQMRDESGNHNGGDLHFGPDDGYLYMSWGDEGSQNDGHNNSQFINKDFWSSITRIDVDLEPGDLGTGIENDDSIRPNSHPAVVLHAGNPLYEIPADNPWVGATTFNGVRVNPANVRTEFFAVGFRNPWRFSFDSETGELWVGDVGQGAWEEVATVAIGSNHGWAWYEGDNVFNSSQGTQNGASRNNATHTPPDWDYRHGNGEFQGNSVTGGVVYRGDNIPELHGKYIFSDYVSGNIWSLERTATPGEPDVVNIAGEGGIAGFGTDPSNGDVLLADLGGQIRRLVSRDIGASFPATLTDTGIFSDLATLTPQPGVVPYDVNLPFWSDHALKQRWFAIKNTTDQVTFSRDTPWSFPDGMVWVKHFDLELERGNPATKKRIETRVLVRNQTPAASTDTILLDEDAPCKVLVPTNSSLEATWMTTGFDDDAWPSATTGVGYDENADYLPYFGTGGNLGNNLNNQNTSLYVRIPFQVTDVASIDTLTLNMKYDDGFVAFINGQRVTDSNPPTSLEWDSEASGQNDDANADSFEPFNIDQHIGLLQNGQNILAIQGLNDGIGSSDMLVLPQLVAGDVQYTEGAYGVSYRWNDAGTEATLVRGAGENIDLTIATPEGDITQTWNIPSRAACNICHTPQAGHALSFNTRQLNRPGTHRGDAGNFLDLLHESGYLDTLPAPPASLPRHVAAHETDYSLEARVRSYLDVNCTYCHQDPGTALPSAWLGNHHLTLHQTGIINGSALAGTQNAADRLVVPGNPDRSVILSRMAASNGYTRMPPLATNQLDETNIQLVSDWIAQEATALTTYTAWRIANFGDAISPEGEPDFDADADNATNQDEWLALTDPNIPTDFLDLSLALGTETIDFDLPAIPNRAVTIEHSTNLSDWLRLDIPGNDGIPRNPATNHSLSTPIGSPADFFRLRVEER